MFAYLDAASGSMIVAALAGGAAGVGVLVKMYWHRILGVFSKKHRAIAEESARNLEAATERREAAAKTKAEK